MRVAGLPVQWIVGIENLHGCVGLLRTFNIQAKEWPDNLGLPLAIQVALGFDQNLADSTYYSIFKFFLINLTFHIIYNKLTPKVLNSVLTRLFSILTFFIEPP